MFPAGSTKPGRIAPVLCSRILVPGPTKLSNSAREPTARMRPPATAIASALGRLSSMVISDPVTRSSALSAFSRRCGRAVRPAGATPASETRAALAGCGWQQPAEGTESVMVSVSLQGRSGQVPQRGYGQRIPSSAGFHPENPGLRLGEAAFAKTVVDRR